LQSKGDCWEQCAGVRQMFICSTLSRLKHTPLLQRVCRGDKRRGAAVQRLLLTWRLCLGGRAYPRIAWAKLRDLREGAAISSKKLWSRR